MNLSTIFLLGFVLLSTFLAAEIPDNVNVEKFRVISEEKQSLASKQRSVANEKKTAYQQKIRARQVLDGQLTRYQNELKLNQATIKGYQDSNSRINATVISNRAKIESNEKRISELRSELSALESTSSLQEEQVSRATSTLSREQQERDGAKADVRVVEGELSAIETGLREAETKGQAAETKLSQAQARIRLLDDEKRQVSGQKVEYEAELVRVRQQRSDQSESVLALEGQSAGIRTRFNQAQSAKADLQSELTDQEALIERTVGQITAATTKIQRLQTDKEKGEKDLEAQSRKVIDAEDLLSDLDIEKTQLEETQPLLESALLEHQGRRQRTQREITQTQTKLATAEGAEKQQLERKLQRLRSTLQELVTKIGEKRDQIAQIREKLLQMPQRKAQGQRTLNRLNREKSQMQTSLERTLGELRTEQTALTGFQQAKINQEREQQKIARRLGQASHTLQLAQREFGEHQSELTQAKRRYEILGKRQEFLQKVIPSVSRALSILTEEAIPKASQAEDEAKQAIQAATTDQQRLTQERGNKERQRDQLRTVLARAEQDVSRASSELQTKRSAWNQTKSKIQSNEQSSASLNSENRSLTSTNESLVSKIASQRSKMDRLTSDQTTINANIVSTTAKRESAKSVEQIAKGAYDLANSDAVALEEQSQLAFNQYKQVQSTYRTQLAAAISLARANGENHGGREGSERGGSLGIDRARTDGLRQGKIDGEREGKARDYQHAFDLAHASHLSKVQSEKPQETAEQKAMRESQSNLQARYETGHREGSQKGQGDGFQVGDNAAKEQLGYATGHKQGENEVYAEADRQFKSVGAKEMEDRIRQSEPKFKEERDATEDSRQSSSSIGESFTQLASWLWSKVVSTAHALVRSTTIDPSEVPEVNFQYKSLKTDYLHPDFNEAYEKSYVRSYRTNYVTQFVSQYQKDYKTSYETHWAKANEQALAAAYEQEKQRGTSEGTLAGTFEGLGYNQGYATGFSDGKSKGEIAAFNRGKARGLQVAKSDAAIIARAKQVALDAGRKQMREHYEQNAKLAWVASSERLEESSGNGKFEFQEEVSLSAGIRNFGGIDAAEDRVKVVVTDAKGIDLDETEMVLAEINNQTQYDYKKLVVGKVTTGKSVEFKAKLLLDGTEVDSIQIKEEIFSPFNVAFRYMYDANRELQGAVHSGFHNLVRLEKKDGSDLNLDGLKVQLISTDGALRFSWNDGAAWHVLKKQGNVLSTDFFLYGKHTGKYRRPIRVKVQDRRQRLIFDQTFSVLANIVFN